METNPHSSVMKQYVYSFIIIISSCFLFNISTGITESGIISFYGSEIVGLCSTLSITFYIVRNWKIISKEYKFYIYLILVFTFYCFADYIIRIFLYGLELKSILIFESNLFVISFLFLILFKFISIKTMITSLSFFSGVLGITSVILYYFLEYNITNEILLNHATRTYLLGILLPIALYNYAKLRNKFSAFYFYVCLSSLIFCGLVSGSRINYTFIPILLLVAIIILLKNKIHFVKFTIFSILIPLVLIIISANFYIYIYAQMTRLPITNAMIKAFNINYNQEPQPSSIPENTESPNNNDLSKMISQYHNEELSQEEKDKLLNNIVIESAKVSTGESSSIRFDAWQKSIADIARNPLFGIGLQQYNSISSDGQLSAPIQPHNFILEYTLSFGLIGFILWVIMISAPILSAIKRIKFHMIKSTACLCMLASILFACAGAFFQPYFIYPSVMTFVYLLIGCYHVSLQQSDYATQTI